MSFSEIRYVLSHRSKILLKVYDPTGILKATLEDGLKDPGRYSILWDGIDDKGERLPQGTYFVKLQAGGYTQTEKLVIMR